MILFVTVSKTTGGYQKAGDIGTTESSLNRIGKVFFFKITFIIYQKKNVNFKSGI